MAIKFKDVPVVRPVKSSEGSTEGRVGPEAVDRVSSGKGSLRRKSLPLLMGAARVTPEAGERPQDGIKPIPSETKSPRGPKKGFGGRPRKGDELISRSTQYRRKKEGESK